MDTLKRTYSLETRASGNNDSGVDRVAPAKAMKLINAHRLLVLWEPSGRLKS